MNGATGYGRFTLGARPGLAGVTRSDVRSACVLLAVLLLYGAAVTAISGVPLNELASHIADFAALSFYSGILVACAFAVACLLRPAMRHDIGRRVFWLAVACLITGLTFPFFTTFKELVLPARGFLWDRAFAHLDRLIAGVPPWWLTHRFFGGVEGTRLFDLAYRFWLPFMFGMPMVSAVLFTDPRLRLRILGTWTLSWIVIGTLGGWVFASAGPCFYNVYAGSSPDYANLLRQLAEAGRQAAAQGHEIASLQYQSGLLQTYRTHDFAPGGGISAMPSMHVAMAALLTIVGFRIQRWLGMAFAAFGVTVWLATIHFGWHYMIDGPVGVLMMASIWLLTKPAAALAYPAEKRPGGFNPEFENVAPEESASDAEEPRWRKNEAA